MPPASTKANYKTYEAQARMVRAIVAAHPDVKWNYKGEQFLFSSCCRKFFTILPVPLSASFAHLVSLLSFNLLFAVLAICLFLLGRRLTLRPRNRRLLWIRHD